MWAGPSGAGRARTAGHGVRRAGAAAGAAGAGVGDGRTRGGAGPGGGGRPAVRAVGDGGRRRGAGRGAARPPLRPATGGPRAGPGHARPAGCPPPARRGPRCPPVDRDAVADAVVRLAALAVDLGDRLAALDVNPLVAGPAGCRAVDALVVATSAGPSAGR